MGAGNGLVPSWNEPLHDPLINICHQMHEMASLGCIELTWYHKSPPDGIAVGNVFPTDKLVWPSNAQVPRMFLECGTTIVFLSRYWRLSGKQVLWSERAVRWTQNMQFPRYSPWPTDVITPTHTPTPRSTQMLVGVGVGGWCGGGEIMVSLPSSVCLSVRRACCISVTAADLDGFFPYLARMITGTTVCIACNDPWAWLIFSRSLSHYFKIKRLKYDTFCCVRSTGRTVPDGSFHV